MDPPNYDSVNKNPSQVSHTCEGRSAAGQSSIYAHHMGESGFCQDMIRVEGYRTFHGTMRIAPKSEGVPPFELTGDWLYKPYTHCWYGQGRSFPVEICMAVSEVSQ